MTSTDTSRHPDVSEISDLTEGILSPSRAVEVGDHVEACELCGDVHASLIEIRELLGAVPAPPHMPDDVAERIDAALAAATPSTTASDGTIRVSRETSPVAANGPEVETSASDRPAGRPRAATGPGRHRTRRRRVAVVGAAFGAAVVGLGVLLSQGGGTSQDTTALKTAHRETGSTASEASFSESTLESRVHTLLRRADRKPTAPDDTSTEVRPPSVLSQSPPGDASPTSEAPQRPLRTPAASVPDCVRQGIGRDTAALAMEAGTFEGTDAFLVVLPDRSDPARVQAYIVDAACTQDGAAAKGKLLLSRAYPRL